MIQNVIKPDEIYKVLERQQKQHSYTVLKLPCGHGKVQLSKAEDQVIFCPKKGCFKRWHLTWAFLDQAKKIREIESNR